MKRILRAIAFNAFALFLLAQLFEGLVVFGGLQTYLITGVVFSVLAFFLKPVISVLTFPFAFLALSVSTILTNAFVLYLLTKILRDIKIHSFTWQGIHLAGFVVPAFAFNTFFAFVVLGLCHYLFKLFIQWIASE